MPTDRPGFPISDIWFDCWRDAFADHTYAVWQGRGGERLHHVRETRIVAGLRLNIVKSATNQQTVRFDLATEEREAGPEFAGDVLQDTGADLLELDFLAPGAKAFQALQSADCRLPRMCEMMARSPYIACQGSFEDWLKTRSYRKSWRQRERRACRDQKMAVQLFTKPAEVASIMDEVLAVDEQSWKAAVGGALQQRPGMVDFYAALAVAAARAGALRLHLLRHEGRTIAFEWAIVSNGTSYGLKKGYVPDYASYSPGVVLSLQVLREVFADPGLERYDMLGGTPKVDPTKANFATGEELLYRMRVFAPTPKGRLAYLAYQGGTRLKQTARPLWLWYKTALRADQRGRKRPDSAAR